MKQIINGQKLTGNGGPNKSNLSLANKILHHVALLHVKVLITYIYVSMFKETLRILRL